MLTWKFEEMLWEKEEIDNLLWNKKCEKFYCLLKLMHKPKCDRPPSLRKVHRKDVKMTVLQIFSFLHQITNRYICLAAVAKLTERRTTEMWIHASWRLFCERTVRVRETNLNAYFWEISLPINNNYSSKLK